MKTKKIDKVDICVITTIHPPFDARIYERGIKSSLEAGFSVCLVSPWQKPYQPWLNHSWICLRPPKRRWERIYHGFKTFLASCRVQAKIYHFHDVDFLLWGVLLNFIKKVPVVYDCHENNPEEIMYNKTWIPLYLRKLLSRITLEVENQAVKKLGYCITVVSSQMERFSKLGVKTILIRNYSAWKPIRNLKHERALICIAGTLTPSHGMNVILEMGRELKRKSINLIIIITDRFLSENYKEHIMKTIQIEDLPIKIYQKVKPKDIASLLSKACIGLSVEQDTPEKRISLPTKLFEYMAFGLPIIASNLPNIRKVIKEADCGILVSPGDAVEFVDAALDLIENQDRFNYYQENGYKAVETIFTWSKERNKLIEFYSFLLENG